MHAAMLHKEHLEKQKYSCFVFEACCVRFIIHVLTYIRCKIVVLTWIYVVVYDTPPPNSYRRFFCRPGITIIIIIMFNMTRFRKEYWNKKLFWLVTYVLGEPKLVEIHTLANWVVGNSLNNQLTGHSKRRLPDFTLFNRYSRDVNTYLNNENKARKSIVLVYLYSFYLNRLKFNIYRIYFLNIT